MRKEYEFIRIYAAAEFAIRKGRGANYECVGYKLNLLQLEERMSFLCVGSSMHRPRRSNTSKEAISTFEYFLVSPLREYCYLETNSIAK